MLFPNERRDRIQCDCCKVWAKEKKCKFRAYTGYPAGNEEWNETYDYAFAVRSSFLGRSLVGSQAIEELNASRKCS